MKPSTMYNDFTAIQKILVLTKKTVCNDSPFPDTFQNALLLHMHYSLWVAANSTNSKHNEMSFHESILKDCDFHPLVTSLYCSLSLGILRKWDTCCDK